MMVDARVLDAATAVETMLDRVHEYADQLAAVVLQSAGDEQPRLHDADLAGIGDVVDELLAVLPWVGGAGFVAALGSVDREHRYWNWWTRSAGSASLLHPPRTASGNAEYAYESRQWFRDGSEGKGCVYGPFVDFAGVNQLVILCSQPVVDGRDFLGIVGVDLVIDLVEIQLVKVLRTIDAPAVLAGSSGRVVASTVAALAPGDRFDGEGWAAVPVDDGRAAWTLFTRPADQVQASPLRRR